MIVVTSKDLVKIQKIHTLPCAIPITLDRTSTRETLCRFYNFLVYSLEPFIFQKKKPYFFKSQTTMKFLLKCKINWIEKELTRSISSRL